MAEVSYKKDARDGWVPSAWKTQWQTPETGKLFNVQDATVTKYSYNQEVSRELFEPIVPPGTFVRDDSQGNATVYWVAMPDGQKHVLTEAEYKANVTYEELLNNEPK